MITSHPFDRSGLAALADLETPEWKKLFVALEREQAEFLAMESRFRSPEYKWPRDPLHTWSRVWEYPYAYHHLKAKRRQWQSQALPRVVDVGSGVTFFPFSVARLGYHVTCTDIDPICARDIPKAASTITHSPGTVDFRLTEGESLPFQNNEVDALVCVSVLEHIPDYHKTIVEMARILRPGGNLVLTIDLDMRGDSEIGEVKHQALVCELERHFEFAFPDQTIHPNNVLSSVNSPWGFRYPKGITLAEFCLKRFLRRVFGLPPIRAIQYVLAAQAFVLAKKL